MTLMVCLLVAASSIHDYEGSWTLDRSAGEERARVTSIESATSTLRPKLRDRLRDNTIPPSELRLFITGDQVMLAHNGRSLTLTVGGAPRRVWRAGQSGEMALRFADGQLTIRSSGKDGTRVTTYSLSTDGQRLTSSVKISGGRLPRPIEYVSTFVRAVGSTTTASR